MPKYYRYDSKIRLFLKLSLINSNELLVTLLQLAETLASLGSARNRPHKTIQNVNNLFKNQIFAGIQTRKVYCATKEENTTISILEDESLCSEESK